MGGGGGGLPWWLATTECSLPPPPSSGTLAFILLSPCPQRALLGALDLLFLTASLILALCRRGADGASPEKESLLPSPTPAAPFRATGRHAVALGASAVTAAASAVLLALAIFLLPAAGTAPWSVVESAFLAAHSAAHAVAAWTVVASAKRASTAATAHPWHLRVFWIATALGAALFTASAAVRCAEGSPLFPDDVLAFASLFVSLPLAYVAITACTVRDEDDEQDQTLGAAAAASSIRHDAEAHASRCLP